MRDSQNISVNEFLWCIAYFLIYGQDHTYRQNKQSPKNNKAKKASIIHNCQN